MLKSFIGADMRLYERFGIGLHNNHDIEVHPCTSEHVEIHPCIPDKAGFITGENICIDGGMTKLMIYHGEHGWTYDDKKND
ncbi:hypothetical protein [Butyrivibrio sp. MC2013]|uniref:hypothetical protein n=1 Tax=Butyrivibrio sp. MC2013 TaxID=1280686 RepID=UPI00042A124A|nr:hypothetical protein [Butyrivibrio sp. MC2013]